MFFVAAKSKSYFKISSTTFSLRVVHSHNHVFLQSPALTGSRSVGASASFEQVEVTAASALDPTMSLRRSLFEYSRPVAVVRGELDVHKTRLLLTFNQVLLKTPPEPRNTPL
jgi:hypothetical protein